MQSRVSTRPSAANEAFFEGGWSDEYDRIDVYASFVLDGIISVAVGLVRGRALAETDVRRKSNMSSNAITPDAGHAGFWLADDYNNLADYPDIGLDERIEHGTHLPLDEGWRSPFVGKTLEDAAGYLRSVPKPRKPLCKTWFAVLDAKLYREGGAGAYMQDSVGWACGVDALCGCVRHGSFRWV
ncbi:hypothetical protein TI39_contig5830g00006 [Zymoseptoria brevis]|uniref:Uncharacterized protein n=1 Tax=Zymoseptoria brevis TaxID=1047168 RepID=A0A0F4G904_9PEZI|nr:hypothetical protein TI39_contig5830g00006 [Zymoseptoria brevis]